MIAIQKPQTIGLAIHPLLGVRESYSLAKPLIKNPNGVQSFSPGLPRVAAATLGGTSKIPTANCKAARSAKLISGHPIRPIRRIRPILPRPKSTIDLGCEPSIKVDYSLGSPLSPALYKPIIRPENKEIKPKSNPYKPKKFLTTSLIKRKKISSTPGSSILNLRNPTQLQATLRNTPTPRQMLFGGQHHQSLFSTIFPFKGIQSYSKQFKGIQSFLYASFFYFMRRVAFASVDSPSSTFVSPKPLLHAGRPQGPFCTLRNPTQLQATLRNIPHPLDLFMVAARNGWPPRVARGQATLKSLFY